MVRGICTCMWNPLVLLGLNTTPIIDDEQWVIIFNYSRSVPHISISPKLYLVAGYPVAHKPPSTVSPSVNLNEMSKCTEYKQITENAESWNSNDVVIIKPGGLRLLYNNTMIEYHRVGRRCNGDSYDMIFSTLKWQFVTFPSALNMSFITNKDMQDTFHTYVSLSYWHIEADTKWPPFSRQYFQMASIERTCMHFGWNFIEVCCSETN